MTERSFKKALNRVSFIKNPEAEIEQLKQEEKERTKLVLVLAWTPSKR